MNQKLLWKIEELWKEYYSSQQSVRIDISNNYNKEGISKYYSHFKKVTKFDFTSSEKPVFTDGYGKYFGLKYCQVIENKGKLIYLFDNHNEMIYSLVEIFGSTRHLYDVVHIDAHPDDTEFIEGKIKELNLDNVSNYIYKTRISDFFDAISEVNLIREIYRVTHSDNLEFFIPPENPYILSLDIDIFGPEGEFAEVKDKVRSIALAWGRADAVCIAMSPGFIDQKYAAEIIKIFIN